MSPQGVVRGPDLDRKPRLSHPHESFGLRCHGDHAIHADHRRVRLCNTIRTIAVIDSSCVGIVACAFFSRQPRRLGNLLL
jgi:hypothetical protein